MAQNIEEKIWEAIKARLDTAKASGSLTYVKNIYEGFQAIPRNGVPALVMEPNSDPEVPHTSSFFVRIKDRIDIHCITTHVRPKDAIIATDPNKGIKDLVGDVKNVINAAPKKLGLSALGNGAGVIWVRFPDTVYTPIEQTYPQREAVITVEVEATFQDTDR